jgi:alkanesulfonate monooxygenase SsuD/methylene tetrahydromethanopterin reductase-like flavin-dependent oxidoreductase (luciferase family)
MQVGLVVMDENPADALKIVRAAERAGIHSLWTIDYYNRSSLARAAAFAAVSETPIVGTSVTPLFARAPLALAAAAADIQGFAGGRFVLGVGSSTRRMNQDWYGTALQHPAPQVRERIELIRRLIAHRSGPFRYEGRFDRVSMAHYDRTALPDSLTILAAGVGEHMVRVAGECADGFVGHTIASASYLRDTARPLLAEGAARADRDAAGLRMTTQIVAAASTDPSAARRDAAA